jgi:hypothetical protein
VDGDPRSGAVAAITALLSPLPVGHSFATDPEAFREGHVVVNEPEIRQEKENIAIALRAAMALFAFSSSR